MATAVKLSDTLAEENPDLPFSFIQETLLAMEEAKGESNLSEYKFG